ncbi:hypothetical protein F2Q70_00042482 [Brassica cretica]|uniref:Uncharacterized protein n=1 Tax=Brassica cretica TaxID=69181 RepID=A0A8S9KN53_BRACR|nr:hypothetical protein F2Q70_00042482 [Brassica cretica]KAF3520370.1 hypothetical protein DY000_02058771 [Brassica cretica]
MDLLVHLEGEDDNLFNGKIISPIDALQLAILEVECWRKASRKEKMNEDHNDYATLLGWSLKDQMGNESFGLRSCNKSLSDLYAEMTRLLWAASCMIYIKILDPLRD